jgi:hypothetical protein
MSVAIVATITTMETMALKSRICHVVRVLSCGYCAVLSVSINSLFRLSCHPPVGIFPPVLNTRSRQYKDMALAMADGLP